MGKIVFESDRDGNFEIYSMNADGTEVTRLNINPADDSQPVWSHNGKKVAFVSNRDGPYNIYVMNADGSGVVRLSRGNWTTIPLGRPTEN